MTLPVDHIHNLDSYITNEGEAFESVSDSELVSMDLWVPSEHVVMHAIDAPSAPRRKWKELIPWILEDRLLQPIEETHFVVTGQTLEGQLQVLVVSQFEMQNWQRIAKNSGITPKAMYPDYMALPYENGRISVGWRDGVCLVRYGVADGFAAASDMAWSMIDALLLQDETLMVSVSVPESVIVPDQIKEVADINASVLDWQFSELPSQCDLLAGSQKPDAMLNTLMSWFPVTLLGLISVLLSVIYLQIASANMVEETTQLENRLMQSYSRLFDGRRPAVNDLRSEVDKNLSLLFSQRNSLDSDPVSGLIALDKFMNGCGCQLSKLSYTKDELVLHIQNGLALTKRRLKVPGYQIGIVQKSGKSKNSIELRLTPKKNGGNQ
jgi:type II secretion system protein L